MKTFLAGSLITASLFIVTGMAAPTGGLTSQQLAVLNTMSIVHVPNGQGGTTQTLRITGVDVQIVNGVGTSLSANGVGNLVMGYNELRNDGSDDHNGSHNIIAGTRNNYSKSCGVNIGFENELHGEMASLISTENSNVSDWCSNITGGYLNTVMGKWSAITSGAYCTNWGDNSHICGGNQNNIYQGTFAGTVGGGSNRAVAASYNWAAGSLYQNN